MPARSADCPVAGSRVAALGAVAGLASGGWIGAAEALRAAGIH